MYGLGERKTPEPFQKACDNTYTESVKKTEDRALVEATKDKKDV